MNSVNNSFAVLRGRRMGDSEKAQGLLDSLPSAQLNEQNKQEGRITVKLRKRFKTIRARYGRS